MALSNTDIALLKLVRAGLGFELKGESLELKAANWMELFDLSEQQGVNGVVCDGIQVLRNQGSNDLRILESNPQLQYRYLQFLGGVMQVEQQYSEHESAIASLSSFYASARETYGELGSTTGEPIKMMVLKGYGLSLNYPHPNHRPGGDIDTYNFGEQRKADELIEEKLDIKVDRSEHHHTVFHYEGQMIENHYDFINVHAHRDAPKIEAKLKELASKGYKVKEVQGSKVYLPSADFNAIFLMRHMGQHFAGEHLNMRQVIDWAMFVEKEGNAVDWNMVHDFYKEIGLYDFYTHIRNICDYAVRGVIGYGNLTEIEKKILIDILHPEFAEGEPDGGFFKVWSFKAKRWWHNRWKHPMVYKEWWLPMIVTLAWSHIRKPESV